MYNQITIVGNVGSCEMRYTPAGVAVCAVSVASNKKFTKADGEKHETVVWFRVTYWRKAAEAVGEHVKKGMKILVTGEFDSPPRTYQDKQGNWVASLEITGETWRVVDWGDKGTPRDIDVSVENSEPIPF